jgi:hypothetical protein
MVNKWCDLKCQYITSAALLIGVIAMFVPSSTGHAKTPTPVIDKVDMTITVDCTDLNRTIEDIERVQKAIDEASAQLKVIKRKINARLGK